MFFFYWYGDHQDLHSFPTRRSSDLCIPGSLGCLAFNDKGKEEGRRDRKSTRLNSSHVSISYAVFCLKKKKLMDRIDETALQLQMRHLGYDDVRRDEAILAMTTFIEI